MINADDDARPNNDPDHDSTFDLSKTTHDNTRWFGVPTVCENSVSQISRGDLALQEESKESLTRETEGKQRLRRDRAGSVISVGESMSRKSTEQYKESFSSDSPRVLFCERDLREHPERRAQIQYNMEIQNSERRNSEYALFESQRELESQRQQILMANHWADQPQRERIFFVQRTEMRSHLRQESHARSCQEKEKLKDAAVKRKTQQDLDELTTQRNQDSFNEQVRELQERLEFIDHSRIFQDPDSPSSYGSTHISHQARIASSSRKPSREPRTPRITRADMSISGDAHDCQHARCDPDDVRNNSNNLAKKKKNIERRNWATWQWRTITIHTFTLFSSVSKYIWSRQERLSYVYDKPCCGYWDLYSKWHDNSELSFLGDASE